MENLKKAGAKVIAIVCDGNRVNQAFFKKFHTIFPLVTKDNLFLLFDYVHIFKNIRNNWITEATQELEFYLNDQKYTARWSDIRKLYYFESQSLSKCHDSHLKRFALLLSKDKGSGRACECSVMRLHLLSRCIGKSKMPVEQFTF